MTKIIPALGLNDIRDSELDEYVQDKVNRINSLPEFAAVTPTTAVVDAKRIEYKDALLAADHGPAGSTQFKDQKRVELEEVVTKQASSCAIIANGDLALYLKTGYKAKDTRGTPTGPLPQVTGFELHFGTSKGELLASWNPMEDAMNFTVQVYSDPNSPDTTIVKEFMTGKIGKRKTSLSGLPTGLMVFARVRANGGNNGSGAWSDPAEKRVP